MKPLVQAWLFNFLLMEHNLKIAVRAAIDAAKAILDIYQSGNFNIKIKADEYDDTEEEQL